MKGGAREKQTPRGVEKSMLFWKRIFWKRLAEKVVKRKNGVGDSGPDRV